MVDSRIARFIAEASRGRMSRRTVLDNGFRLGVALPTLAALAAIAPEAAVAAPRLRAFARQDGGSGGTFTNIITIGTEDIDPHYSYATLVSTVAMAAYEMLVQYKGESTSEVAPMLAQSWEVSDDLSTYTFTLPEGATFQDGTPCDAEAVKASFTRFLDLGGAPVLVIARFMESADMMEAVDATTIRFNLGKPQPLFLAALASQYGPVVVSPTAMDANKTDDDPFAHEFFKANAVGTGPYQLVSNSLTEGLIFERFENYHRGWEGNHFDQVIFRVVPEEATRRQLLEQGQADASAYNLTTETVNALRETEGITVVEYPTTAVGWAILNVPRLGTVEARQGLSYAFPYDDVQNSVFAGMLRRTGPISDNTLGYDPDVFLYQTDLEKAKELLTAGGIAEGSTLEYMFDANDEREATVAQLFQAKLAEIGYNLELFAVDYATVESTIFGDMPTEEKPHVIGGWGWWPDYNDPTNQLEPNFTAANIGNGGSNGGAWENARFEEIMAEAVNFTDEARLNELMKEAQNIITEQDPPAIFYGQVVRFTVLRSDIQGFVPNPLYLDSYNFYDMSRAAS